MITEKKHLENLLFIRGLIKHEIDTWVEGYKEGEIKRLPEVINLATDLSLVEECIGGLHSKCELIKRINERA